jgi:hypothetical protein
LQSASHSLPLAIWFSFPSTCNLVLIAFYFAAKPDEKTSVKKTGIEIGKQAAEKSKGLFSADDWMCTKSVICLSFVCHLLFRISISLVSFYNQVFLFPGIDVEMSIGRAGRLAILAMLPSSLKLNSVQVCFSLSFATATAIG